MRLDRVLRVRLPVPLEDYRAIRGSRIATAWPRPVAGRRCPGPFVNCCSENSAVFFHPGLRPRTCQQEFTLPGARSRDCLPAKEMSLRYWARNVTRCFYFPSAFTGADIPPMI